LQGGLAPPAPLLVTGLYKNKLKALVKKTQATPNLLQRQKVDPAASNSDTLVDLAVTFYPVHTDCEEE